jgi:beta-phosphoglucomutase family hydrolase
MRAILFDMDGVLILSGPAHHESWRRVAAPYGIDFDDDIFHRTFGRTNPDIIRMIWPRDVPVAEAAAIADSKERAYREMVRADPPLAPGLRLLLEGFSRDGFVLGIGSSGPRENIDLILDAGDLRRFFSAIVDGSMVTRGKPAPDVFLIGARQAGVDPSHCAVVEDAPAGIQAAVAAGMVAIGVETTHPRQDLLAAGAAVTLPALADLRAEHLQRR